MASISLGGTTIPNVITCDRSDIFIGKQERAHDGTLLTDYTAQLVKWDIEAELLTEIQRNTVKSLAESTATQSFVDLDGNSFSVVAKQDTYAEKRAPLGNSDVRYDVRFSVEEAA